MIFKLLFGPPPISFRDSSQCGLYFSVFKESALFVTRGLWDVVQGQYFRDTQVTLLVGCHPLSPLYCLQLQPVNPFSLQCEPYYMSNINEPCACVSNTLHNPPKVVPEPNIQVQEAITGVDLLKQLAI